MKLKLEEKKEQEETEVIIRYAVMDQEVKHLIEMYHTQCLSIKAVKADCYYQISVDHIHYIEAVDDHTFLYCEQEVYECQQRLYELEALLKQASFVRISKSCIVNIYYLKHVKPLFDGKFIATTTTGEKLVINRHYVKGFKEVFGL